MNIFLLPFEGELVFLGSHEISDPSVGSLASSSDPDVVCEALDFILSPEVINML